MLRHSPIMWKVFMSGYKYYEHYTRKVQLITIDCTVFIWISYGCTEFEQKKMGELKEKDGQIYCRCRSNRYRRCCRKRCSEKSISNRHIQMAELRNLLQDDRVCKNRSASAGRISDCYSYIQYQDMASSIMMRIMQKHMFLKKVTM